MDFRLTAPQARKLMKDQKEFEAPIRKPRSSDRGFCIAWLATYEAASIEPWGCPVGCNLKT